MSKSVLILERSSKNLKKITNKGKVILEGVFAEFGVENRNGRVYEEREYLPHLEYLKKDIAKGTLLGELDHPEIFEVSLNNVSHRISELWYDEANRQVKGKIEILDTPKGQIAKTLLESGVPLSISSRAAGTVNEDKSVKIDQIYTYDLVIKPGFEAAQLELSESVNSRLNPQITKLNESVQTTKDHDISSKLGILNENVSIIDVSDKYPSVPLRDEALRLKEHETSDVKNKNVSQMEKNLNENEVQQWTLFFKKELSKINEKLKNLENSVLNEGTSSNTNKEIKLIKRYVNKLKKVQEDSLAWQGDIAKAVNKVANYADTLAEKSNEHYDLTKKIQETVDYNATVQNHLQDWVSENAKVTNTIVEAVDYNADVQNKLNEWTKEIAQGVNALHEWGEEKAKAINAMHEWTSDVAKNLNLMANWSEEMFGRAMSKSDAKKLMKYVELVSESKKNPKLKKHLDEILKKNGINGKKLNESILTGIAGIKGLGTITNVKTVKGEGKPSKSSFKPQIIVGKDGKLTFSKSSKPKQLKTIEAPERGNKPVKKDGRKKVKGIVVLDKVTGKAKVKVADKTGKVKTSSQNLKLDVKPTGSLKESFNKSNDIKKRSSKLDEKLNKIINIVEKEKKIDESIKHDYPFTSLLNESDRQNFAKLSVNEKKAISEAVNANPTTDPDIIKALWENTLATKKQKENAKLPLWLSAAPTEYKEAFEKAPEAIKESIKARSEFYTLETKYQIENFWQTSGLNPSHKNEKLNEVFTPNSKTNTEKKSVNTPYDSVISYVEQQMQRYNNV